MAHSLEEFFKRHPKSTELKKEVEILEVQLQILEEKEKRLKSILSSKEKDE